MLKNLFWDGKKRYYWWNMKLLYLIYSFFVKFKILGQDVPELKGIIKQNRGRLLLLLLLMGRKVVFQNGIQKA